MQEVGSNPQELAKGLKFQSVAEVVSPLLSEFYSYVGSTTYPPCYQRVQVNQAIHLLASVSLIDLI